MVYKGWRQNERWSRGIFCIPCFFYRLLCISRILVNQNFDQEVRGAKNNDACFLTDKIVIIMRILLNLHSKQLLNC